MKRASLLMLLCALGCGEAEPQPAAVDGGQMTSDTGADAMQTSSDVGVDLASGPDVGVADLGAPANGWRELAPLPAPQQEVAVVVLDGLVYVMGGFGATAQQLADVNVYDPETDRWSGRADFPVRANHMNAVVLDGEIWVTGFLANGFNADGRTFIYSPVDDAWRPGPDLPAGRGRGASAVAVIAGEIYVAGGVGENGTNDLVDALNPTSGVWVVLPNAPRAFDHAGYGVIDDKLYVAAGRNGAISSYVDQVHVFDPATREWADLAPIPTARGGVASAVLDDRLYVFGGEGDPNSPGRVFPDVEVYDPASDTWTALEPMPRPRHGLAGAVLNGAIHLPGGAPTEFLDATDTHDAFVP